MSVASEINRLESAKEAIKAAIENKGVEVPENTKLDEMATFINLIAVTPTENYYEETLEANTAYTKTIPDFEQGKSLVDVYLNGLRLMKEREYTISQNGLLTLIQKSTTGKDKIIIVHWRWS